MNQINCKLCSSISEFEFESKILNKYIIKYYRCKHCELIQTENPSWLNEAYQNSISYSDTGIFERNYRISKLILMILSLRKEEEIELLKVI